MLHKCFLIKANYKQIKLM